MAKLWTLSATEFRVVQDGKDRPQHIHVGIHFKRRSAYRKTLNANGDEPYAEGTNYHRSLLQKEFRVHEDGLAPVFEIDAHMIWTDAKEMVQAAFDLGREFERMQVKK